MDSVLEEIAAEVKRRGVTNVARDGDLDPKTIRRFLQAPLRSRMSTFQRIARAVDMPLGEVHLKNLTTGRCITCDDPSTHHVPLLPEMGQRASAS